ncbi:MAG TPA: hypothetical protein DCY31_00105 [Ruminococcaceae bacterium]|mgnify:CR=1 FL=1|nr:hypothetical protein [Oscillospiraceae bacterium]
MIFSVPKKIFSIFLAVVVFFGNISAARKDPSPADEAAVRVKYGDGICESYDMFLPESKGEVDVVFMIHGGAWMMGDQTMFEQNAKNAAENGFVGVTVDYDKITNGATSADMVQEMYNAVADVKAKLAELGYTADKMVVAGHSAGAHIALLYSYLHYADSPIEIGFVCSNSAPSDFFDANADSSTTMTKFRYLAVSALIGELVLPNHMQDTEEKIKANNPVDLVTSDVPPTIVVHGNKDTMVSYSNSVELYDRLQDCNVDSVFITYAGSDHFLEGNEDGKRLRTAAFMNFVEKYL